jgi:hypothetical protein
MERAKSLLVDVEKQLRKQVVAAAPSKTAAAGPQPKQPKEGPTAVKSYDKAKTKRRGASKVAPRIRRIRAKYAFLTVTSQPFAMVYIDGHLSGYTPQKSLRLPAGPHTVSLKGKNVKPYVKRVVLKPGERQSLDVELREVPAAVAVAPVTDKPPTTATTTPPKQPKLDPPKKHDPPKPAPQRPKQAIVDVPYLRLPPRVKVRVHKEGGQRKAMVRAVCMAVEKVVSRATGRSAAGKTAAFQRHIYATYQNVDDQNITLYPRVMGYLVAEALLRNKPGVGSRLVRYHKNGKLASLAGSNWRP